MALGGVFLKSLSLVLRFIQFCCAAVVIAIFSYFLATLHNHDLPIATYIRAVEGISGAAVIYTIFALLLVCCLGGIAFFSLLGMLLDVAFGGAFIYVAHATRGGTGSCNGNVNTPFGNGNTNSGSSGPQGSAGFTALPSWHTACRLETACFAVSIVAVIFFLLSIPVELLLIRHRRKERAFGPSPNNGYTAGSPKRKFWQRRQKRNTMYEKNGDALPTHVTPADIRTSYATDTTAVGGDGPLDKYANSTPYGTEAPAPGVGVVHGYQTTTTTHAPIGHQAYETNPTGAF